MARSSVVVKTEDDTYRITQGTNEYTDCRSWYLNKTGLSLGFTDLNEVVKVDANGAMIGTSPFIGFGNVTMCINREETIAFILHYFPSGGTGPVELKTIDIATMAVLSSIDLSVSSISPLRAIISPDEKIVWLGDNGYLYKMDLDGGNLDSVYIGASGENALSFCLDSNGNLFTFTGDRLIKIPTTLPLSIGYENIYSQVAINRMFMGDGFVLGEYAYMIGNWDGDSKLFKIPLATWKDNDTWTKLYLDTIGITNLSEAQFNASGADNFATFSCTVDGRQTVMQCNLDTLECMPARRVNYANREIEYSNDTGKPIERLGIDITKANNCDWKGLLTTTEGPTGSV